MEEELAVTINKAKARAWLFILLARIETCENVMGDLKECGNITTLRFAFDVPEPELNKKEGENNGD